MIRTLCGFALTICLATPVRADPIELHRGIGVHDWLNWSPVFADQTYMWPPYRSVADWLAATRPISDWPKGDEFARIRSMGFDFVRLSVDPGPLASTDGEKRQQVLDLLARNVERVTSTGLKVVFDLHGVSQVPAYSMKMIYDGADSEGVARYRQMVVDVARMLAKVGVDKVALEPYNEPAYYPCDSSGTDDWQRIMTDTVRDIRSVSTELTIVATGACGGSVAGLANLNPAFDDPNIYYSFHMYEPHSFTHQRSERADGFLSGLPWPASKGTPAAVSKNLEDKMDKAGISADAKAASLAEAEPIIDKYFRDDWGQSQLDERFSKATGWAKSHGIPTQRLFMGEFGAILMPDKGNMGATNADRLRYLVAVRQAAEAAEIPWSLWEYSNPYGMSLIAPKGPAIPDEDLLKALGL